MRDWFDYLDPYKDDEEEEPEENPYEEEDPGRITAKVWRKKDEDDTEADS